MYIQTAILSKPSAMWNYVSYVFYVVKTRIPI